MELLDREVIKMKDGEVIETKTVKEVIDTDNDIWMTKQGQFVLKHEGVLKLADFVGATWDEPRKEDVPSAMNDKGFYYLFTCRFPDGSSSLESGEANDLNTGKGTLSHRYKQSMALKRGMDRSFLRSSYMKMYDVYSAEEADDFTQDRLKHLQQENAAMKTQLHSKTKLVQQMTEFISLDADDEKYPNQRVLDIWNVHRDEEYLGVLSSHADPVISWMAKGVLMKIQKTKAKEDTPKQAANA